MPRNFITKPSLPLSAKGFPVLQIKMVGQWADTIRIIGRLDPAIKGSSVKAQMKVCNEIAKKVKAHIRNQDLGWKDLSPAYAAQKEKAGLGGKVLMAYHTYYDSIQVWRVGNQHLVNVGVKKGIYTRRINGKRSKLDVATIAAIHEFSSGRKLARRPLWNPTILELGGAKGIKKMYLGSLIYHLRMAGIPVKPFQNII